MNGRLSEAGSLELLVCVDGLVDACHGAAKAAGWWNDPATGQPIDLAVQPLLVAAKLALVHSEVSEALEAFRKDANDDHLPYRKGVEVELADALIRICDLAGAMSLDLPGAVVDKMFYNAKRADHKPEQRVAKGGKRF